MVPNSLAETVTVCGLAKGFIEKYGHGITLVIPESHAFIAECFPNTFDRIVYLSLGNMRQFSETGFIPKNFFSVDFPINTWPKQNGDGRAFSLYELWNSTLGRSGLNFLDLYRYVLRLDWSTKFTPPLVPKKSYDEAMKLINQYGIKPKKTVILFVGNNSNKPSPANLWKKIAKLYFEQGFDIVVNKCGAMLLPDDLSIPNATIIDIPLDLTIPVSEYAGSLVSGSNGFVFLALAAKVNCDINVLLPNEICVDYQNVSYAGIHYMAGCHQLGVPELTNGMKMLREWIVPKLLDDVTADEIAYGIVHGVNNKYTVANSS